MIKIGLAVSTSDNDQVKVKAAMKDYVDMKPVWTVCVCFARMLKKSVKTKFVWQIFVFF